MKSKTPLVASALLLAALALATPALLHAAPRAAVPEESASPQGAPPQPAPPGDEITLEKIMADPDWIGNAPEDPFWSADSRSAYYERKRQGEKRKDLWRVDVAGRAANTAPEKLDDRAKATAETGQAAYSQDRRLKVYVREGDLYLRDAASGKLRQLTRTTEQERAPRFL